MPLIPGLARYWIEGDLSKVDSWARREATETAMADPQATVWLGGRFEPSREYLLVIEARPVGELELRRRSELR